MEGTLLVMTKACTRLKRAFSNAHDTTWVTAACNQASAPECRVEVVDQLRVRMQQRPIRESARTDEPIARFHDGPPTGTSRHIAVAFAGDHGFDSGESQLRDARVLDDARISQVRMPSSRVGVAKRTKRKFAEAPTWRRGTWGYERSVRHYR